MLQSGNLDVFCELHANMKGTVVVQEAARILHPRTQRGTTDASPPWEGRGSDADPQADSAFVEGEPMESRTKRFGHPIHPLPIPFPLGWLGMADIFDKLVAAPR